MRRCARHRWLELKRLVPALLLIVLLLPAAAAHGVPCSPLSCAPSQFLFARGTLLGVRAGGVDRPFRVIDLRTGATRWRLPAGVVTGNTLVHQDGSLLTWFDAASGARLRDVALQLHGAFSLVGTSSDAGRAVLARTQTRSTTFAIVSRTGRQLVSLGGNGWQFDALNGDNLFLIRSAGAGYQVRLYDLATQTLAARPLKDPGESATIAGIPFARASSPNGRYLFTLYVGNTGGAMVHELDLRNATARCIDLPGGGGGFAAAMTYSLVVDPDGRTLWAISPGYGRVAAIDVASHRVRDSYPFAQGRWNSSAGIAVMAPDGERIAVSDAQHLWFVELAQRKVARGRAHVAIALGFAPDQSRLWVVGERSRVVALPVVS